MEEERDPDYLRFIAWLRGRCFDRVATARTLFDWASGAWAHDAGRSYSGLSTRCCRYRGNSTKASSRHRRAASRAGLIDINILRLSSERCSSKSRSSNGSSQPFDWAAYAAMARESSLEPRVNYSAVAVSSPV